MENYSTTRQHYRQKFESVLAGLNQSQLDAVNTIDGPVLTIAGPGTGKTHILAARIGQILLETDAAPYNILCLTYTDAGVMAMRKRLLEFIGPDAHKIHIFTFHSFCNKVIQDNIDAFGYDELQPVSDLEVIDIIRGMIDGLSPNHPLRLNNRRNPYQFEIRLKSLFSRMKTEGWEAEYVSQMIDEYIESLPQREEYIYKRSSGEFKKGDVKIKDVAKETQRMEELRAAALLFKDFEAGMSAAGRYDYEDMILWVLRLFKNPEQEDILRNYQEQYLYVLVDEFQDTNGAQSGILMKLIEYWEQPNVFVVGDDDQSIFEFQGARVKNMIDFFEHYRDKGMHLIVLEENYRSGQPILDAAKQIIDRNQLRIIRHLEKADLDIHITKNLTAANTKILASEINLTIKEYPNKLQEEIDIINQIKTLHKKGIPYKEMAVIYYMHRQAVDLIRMLERHEIPYQTKRQINILTAPLIQNLLQLLRYIAIEFEKPYSGEESVYELLHFDFWGISPIDISILTAFLAKNNRKKHDNGDYDYLQWRDLLRDAQTLNEIGLSNPNAILAVAGIIDEAMPLIVNQPLPDFLEKLLNRSGLIGHILKSPEKAWLIELIGTFFKFVRDELQRNPKLDLKGLLVLVERMEANKLELPVIKGSYAEDGVNLLTAHSAKGLEFDCVFMMNCLKDFWEPGSSKGNKLFALPDNLRMANADTDTVEAARRLFYVAMTRAKTFLQLSYYSHQSNQKLTKRSEFLDNLILDYNMEVIPCTVAKEQLMEEQLLVLEQKNMPDSAKIDSDTIAALLDDFRLSVSSLNTYLECPRSFYFQYVLRIPTTSSVEALYGDAVHNALRKIFEEAKAAKSKEIPPLEVFLDAFKDEMFKRSIQFSARAYDDALVFGMAQLPIYYEQRYIPFGGQLAEGVWTEKPFRTVAYKGVPLTGIIDKICFVGKDSPMEQLHVVDYKTGKMEEKRFSPINSRNAKGGTYYRQLVFYKILIENSGLSNLQVKSAEIDYLSPDESSIFPNKKMYISDQDVVAVGNLIVETYDNIKEQRFSEGCNKTYCKWCNFVKNQLSPDSFRDEEEELLDD